MFEGDFIRLRSFKIEDIETSLRLIEESGIKEMISSDTIFPYSYENQKEYIENVNKKRNSNIYNFVIENKTTNEFMGSCGISEYRQRERIAKIGIFLGKNYQNKGYGYDALSVLCKFIFEEVNTNKIVLDCFEYNKNAYKLYKKLGFKEEGILRKEIYRFGTFHNIIYMGLLKEEFENSI